MNFIAPNQEIENEIVNFCLDELKIPFGDFWYNWFNSNKECNHTLHILSVNNVDVNRENLKKLSFVKRIFNLKVIDLNLINHKVDDISYIYYVVFSSIEKV